MKYKKCGMSEDAVLNSMHHHSNILRRIKIGVLELKSPAKTWKTALLKSASGMELRKVRIKKVQDEEIKAHAINDVELSKDVGAGRFKDYVARIAHYLEVNGKRKYPI